MKTRSVYVGTAEFAPTSGLSLTVSFATVGRSRPCGRLRLVARVAERSKWDDDTVPVCEREDAVADQLDGLIDSLDALTEAATKAHQQSHGNRRKKTCALPSTCLPPTGAVLDQRSRSRPASSTRGRSEARRPIGF
jgi:hypothetical protein